MFRFCIISGMPVYQREAFVPGLTACGPMIIEQMDCTTVIPPNWNIKVDGYRNIHADLMGGAGDGEEEL